MQQPVVMAFRKRVKNRGYAEVSIHKINLNEFMVKAIEPLSKTKVERIYTLAEMSRLFK